MTSRKIQTNKESILRGFVWSSGYLEYSELPNIFSEIVKVNCFAERTEKSRIVDNLLHNEVEEVDDHGCHKIRDLVEHEADEEV